MKKTAIIIASTGFLFSAVSVSAEVSVNVSGNSSHSSVNVHQEGSSQVTTCTNGKCTTTGSTGKATVCRDGVCTTSEDGNYDYESEDGSTKIHIKSDMDASDETDDGESHDDAPLTITPNPTIEEKLKDAEERVETAKKEAEEKTSEIKTRAKALQDAIKTHAKDEDTAVSSLFKSFEKFFDNLFNHASG